MPQNYAGQFDPVRSADARGGGMPELVRVPAVVLTPLCRQREQPLSLGGIHPRPTAGDLLGGGNVSELFGHAEGQFATTADRVVVGVDRVADAWGSLRPLLAIGFPLFLGFDVFRFFALST